MTKNVSILGAGTAGALVANTLVRKLDLSQCEVTLVDCARERVYQPGPLFLPYRVYGYQRREDVARPIELPLPAAARLVNAEVEATGTTSRRVPTGAGAIQYPWLTVALACDGRARRGRARIDVGAARLLHHVSGEHRSLAGAAGDDDRPRAITRERGDGLVLVPFAALFEDSAQYVARVGYPPLSDFCGVAHGTFVMPGDYACAPLMTRTQLWPSPRRGPIDPDQAPGARARYFSGWGSGFCSPVAGCAHDSRREPSSFVPTMRWGGFSRPTERAGPDGWSARGRPALPLR